MTHHSARPLGAAVITAAVALLLAVTLVPEPVSAQEIQQLAPDEEHGGKGASRHFDWADDEDYAESFGTQEVGHFETPMGFNADVWAHGRYAYLGSWGSQSGNFDQDGDPTGEAPYCPSQGVRVVDLIDPRNPRHVATFADGSEGDGLDGSWTEKVVVADVDTAEFSGTLAAVSLQGCDLQPERPLAAFRGFGLYDVTDPTDPQRLALVETVASNGSHEIFLEARDGEAYVYTAEINQELNSGQVDENNLVPDLRIFDVSDPTDPDHIGDWGIWSDEGTVPDEPDGDGIPRSRFVHSVIVSDETAFVSYWDRGTVLLDVSDPATPSLRSSVDIPTEGTWSRGSAHSAWIADGGDLLIETQEVFNPDPQDGSDQEYAFGYPRFTDISDPDDPEVIGTFELEGVTRAQTEDLPPGDWTVHDPKVRPGLPGDDVLAYFSWYSEGVVVTDVTDPAEGVDQIAQYVPEPHPDPFGFFQPDDVAFPNVWGVSLHDDFAGRGQYALASDMNSGLWVFRLDEEAPDGACDDLTPADVFDDLSEANTHYLGISCALTAGITSGTSEDPPLFSPTRPVTRAQMATFVAQTLEAAGHELPEADDQIFADVAPGHTHYDGINRLARAEIVRGTTGTTFSPNASVRRGQTATFLIQALEWALDDGIEPGGDAPFVDIVGTTHEANITSAAELGLVLGRADGTYGPSDDTRRDQMATVVTRLLGSLELSLFSTVGDGGNDTDPTDPVGSGRY